MERVWPDTIVEENNLQVQISSLRKVLGTDAIATVPGRGYRLCLALGVVRRTDEGPSFPEQTFRRWPERPALLGRDEDLARTVGLLERSGIVTLTGPGGVGKTALARLVAQRWREQSGDDVAWADLAPLKDPTTLVATLAGVLGIEMPPGGTSMAELAHLVKRRSMLLVLDNVEHLADAVAEMTLTLTAVEADLRLLITSREPLHVRNESVSRLSGLEVPEPGVVTEQEIRRKGAVALFIRCAENADVKFGPDSALADIAAVCRRLDGLPLAIEMAASRVASLGVAGLRVGLEQHWRLLTSRARVSPSRHETLEATLDWSHALLNADEQRTLRRLALFANGFTLDAAREVATETGADHWAVADALAALIDKSVVVAEATEPPRYRLLETVRAYARDKLVAAGELAMIRVRMLHWLQGFFVAADDSSWTTSERIWRADVRPELPNLRSALSDAFEEAGAREASVRVIAAALLTWLRLGEEEAEPRTLADRALVVGATDRATEARLQFGRGVYYGGVDVRVSMDAFRRSVELAEGQLGARDRAHILLSMRGCSRVPANSPPPSARCRTPPVSAVPCRYPCSTA